MTLRGLAVSVSRWGQPLIALALLSLSLVPGVSAAELSEIQRRGHLIVAVKDNVRPLGFRSPDGTLQGLEIDLARRLAAEFCGTEAAIALVPVSQTERLQVVLEDRVDLTIAQVTATDARSRVVNFSVPYYMDGTAFITRQTTVQQFSDLLHAPIAIVEGSSAVGSVRFLLPHSQVVGVQSYQQAQERLASGQVTAFAGDATVLAGWVQEDPRYHLLPTLISAEPLSVVLPKGVRYDPLRMAVNQAIDRWQKQGWLQERIRYWGLPEDRHP